jgi:amino acid adenylation domain-containing protein
MLFHSLYAPRSGVYIEQILCSLHENLNTSAFGKAWRRVIERHPVMRTSFRWKGLQESIQEVHQRVECPLELHDWRDLAKAEQDARLEAFLCSDRQRGFDLNQAPLMRFNLFRWGEEDYRFVWSYHHILLDGGSYPLVLKEVFAFYEAFCQGQDLKLEMPRPYRDYVEWQKKQDSPQSEMFWRQLLQDFRFPTPLMAERATYLPEEDSRYGSQQVRLSAALSDDLRNLARQHDLTLNTLLQGAWALILSRYSGEEDVAFGIVRAGRQSALDGVGSNSMIGVLINTVPVRVHAPDDTPLVDWLQDLRSLSLAMRPHEHTPLVNIQEWSDVPRGTPLFESLVTFQKYVLNSYFRQQGEPWLHREFRVFSRANYPITLMGYDDGTLLLKIRYHPSRFDQAAICRLLGHVQTVLASFAAQPAQKLGDVSLLTEAERRQLLVEWNDTRADYIQDQCIHQLFEAQVRRTPQAPAAIYGSETLTYQELNQRANQLAHYLRKLGVGPEVPVGISVERSLAMVVGVLGILKAGGAYVPLDPAYPRERLASMLDDIQSPILLTQQYLAGQLPQGGTVICLDADWATISSFSQENPSANVSPENMAYVIFTSGSTGKPKGVVIQHRPVLNLLAALDRTVYAEPRQAQLRVSMNGPLSFDTSVKQLIQLLNGHTLVIVPAEVRLDGEALLACIQRNELDVLDCTPSQLNMLLAAGLLVKPGHKPKRILIAGEAIDPAAWRALIQAHDITFYNLYGPTECTVDATIARIQPANNMPTIGRPLANVQVHILDRHLRLAPVGLPGELCIGGAGLARGYLNDARLTAAKFIPHPFSDEPGARLYRTGDLARHWPDGNIEFLGRIDNQIKIRGFRIELGEIESALEQHPAVHEAVVIAREDTPGQKRLVAYVIPRPGLTITISDAHDFLRATLPDYMLPSALVRMEKIPLTPNGKLDRRALPAPDMDRPELKVAYAPPRNPVEQALASLWGEVLCLDHIGVHDNFFELGGHSLQAVQLVSQISSALNHAVSVKDLFTYPTIAMLAEALDHKPLTKRQVQSTHTRVERLEPEPATHDSVRFQIVHHSLLSLFATSKIGPIDSAALTYLRRSDFSRDDVVRDWFDDLPVCHRVIETSLGRIAVILLPRFDSELYNNGKSLAEVIIEALELAKHLGARTVSLAGLIPSATNYGCDIALASEGRQGLPPVSTGHATTIASVVLAIKHILQESGRQPAQERVGVLGLGSIGAASLRLMLKCLPPPAEIILCDLYSKFEALERVKQEIRTDFEFQGPVRVVRSYTEAPPEFYDATLVIGATNVADVLDVARLRPGTMIVDDSGPHCFRTDLATQRLEEQGDVLFTEGGVLKSPQPIREIRYAPKVPPDSALSELEQVLVNRLRLAPDTITGCVFSSLLSACFEDIKPTLGLVNVKTSLQHYEKLVALGFQAADLHCGSYVLAQEAIRNFCERFGTPMLRTDAQRGGVNSDVKK